MKKKKSTLKPTVQAQRTELSVRVEKNNSVAQIEHLFFSLRERGLKNSGVVSGDE